MNPRKHTSNKIRINKTSSLTIQKLTSHQLVQIDSLFIALIVQKLAYAFLEINVIVVIVFSYVVTGGEVIDHGSFVADRTDDGGPLEATRAAQL